MKSGKQQMTEGIKQQNQGKIRIFGEKETYKYSGILTADTFRQDLVKEEIKKEYFRRMRKLLETKLENINLSKRINDWAVLPVRYSGLFLEWTMEEFQQIEKRTKKLKLLHQKK